MNSYISDEQKTAVESMEKYKIIQGCAGSHKTDTLIKALLEFMKRYHGRPEGNSVICLTRVSSVTNEIKYRIEKKTGSIIKKQGSSNHFLGDYCGGKICISNFDAWVHHMLQEDVASKLGSRYKEKTSVLYELCQKEKVEVKIKNSKKNATLIIIDEFQDLNIHQVNILINIIKNNNDIHLYVAGDILQSIFKPDSYNFRMSSHPMNLLKEHLESPLYLNMNLCLRCPAGHISFVNSLFEETFSTYGLSKLETKCTNNIDKPFLFGHTSASNNSNGLEIGKMLQTIISNVMAYDSSVSWDDIVVIMKNSDEKKNHIYTKLPVLFGKDIICHMATKGQDKHNTLDWNKAKDKIKLVSIHGIKGKGAKLVIFLGFSQFSIPMEKHIGTENELFDLSLAYVALSRSTRYLFVGHTNFCTSQYLEPLRETADDNDLFYSAESSRKRKLPEPYNSIASELIKKHPNNIYYKKRKLDSDTNKKKSNTKEVRDDIAIKYESAYDLGFEIQISCEKFSENVVCYKTINEECHCMIMGTMCELLLRNELNVELPNYFELIQSKKIRFSDDHKLICFFKDFHDTGKIDTNVPKKYLIELNAIKEKVIFLMHTNFKEFIHDLEIVLISKRYNQSKSWWNFTIFHIMFQDSNYKPYYMNFLNYFHEPIDLLVENIKFLKQKINFIASNLKFEIPIHYNATDYSIHINGRIDVVDKKNKIIYEVKASKCSDCSVYWTNQVLLYKSFIQNQNSKYQDYECKIINILDGKIYSLHIEKQPPFESLINKICRKLLEQYADD
jgi:hypothetical protein